MKKSTKIVLAVILVVVIAYTIFLLTNDTAKENLNKGYVAGVSGYSEKV